MVSAAAQRIGRLASALNSMNDAEIVALGRAVRDRLMDRGLRLPSQEGASRGGVPVALESVQIRFSLN